MAKEGQKLAFLCLFQPKIVTILLSGYNAKENTNSSHPKNAKKHNFGAFLNHFLQNEAQIDVHAILK